MFANASNFNFALPGIKVPLPPKSEKMYYDPSKKYSFVERAPDFARPKYLPVNLEEKRENEMLLNQNIIH